MKLSLRRRYYARAMIDALMLIPPPLSILKFFTWAQSGTFRLFYKNEDPVAGTHTGKAIRLRRLGKLCGLKLERCKLDAS